MNQSLYTSLKQEQTLSPQMLQSLALLNMPITDLHEYIREEIESNPALEIPEREFENPVNSEEKPQALADDYLDDADASVYENLSAGFSGNSDEKNQAIENTSDSGESLTEHLEKQLGESDVSEETEEIARLLISNLDANGFFVMSLEALFENKTYSKANIEEALSLVRSFDPYGICVADFRQSLILQAQCSGMAKSDLAIFSELVNNHLQKMKEGKTKEVSILLKISEQDLDTFWNILKSLTPYPGRNYTKEGDSFIVPEFSIHAKDGSLVLDMNNGGIPELSVSSEFASLAKDSDAASYVRESIKRANELINQVKMRNQTINRTALSLMEKQSDFFLYGPRALKPMTLKDLADEIGVHETTMSRLSQSKYIETDFGTLPLKFFFTQGVKSSDGQEISRNAVKDIIAEILADNPKLSDQKISEKLLERGIKCARRTVNKYRTEMENS